MLKIRSGSNFSDWALFMALLYLLQYQGVFNSVINSAQNNYKPGQFGYGKGAGPRSGTITGATQNAGSEKKQPSSGSLNYIDVMKKLDQQSHKKLITIEVADETYNINNQYLENADELQFVLAEKVYDSIRESDTDISDIASNL